MFLFFLLVGIYDVEVKKTEKKKMQPSCSRSFIKQ